MTTFEKFTSNHGQCRVLQLVYYIFGNVCVCVCVYVGVFAIGTRTVGATELKLGTELGFHPEKVISTMRAGCTNPGGRALKTGSRGLHSPNGAFLGKLYETKVEEPPF